jgi:hypothetical protein
MCWGVLGTNYSLKEYFRLLKELKILCSISQMCVCRGVLRTPTGRGSWEAECLDGWLRPCLDLGFQYIVDLGEGCTANEGRGEGKE